MLWGKKDDEAEKKTTPDITLMAPGADETLPHKPLTPTGEPPAGSVGRMLAAAKGMSDRTEDMAVNIDEKKPLIGSKEDTVLMIDAVSLFLFLSEYCYQPY